MSTNPATRDLTIVYLDQIMRASMGKSPAFLGQAANPTSLERLAAHLAECEQAFAILRSKGYGKPFTSILELAAMVPPAKAKSPRKP